MTPRVHLIWQIDPHSERIWEYDWLSSLLADFEVEHVVDLAHREVRDRALVVTQGDAKGGVSVDAYLRRFREAGHRVGVFHVSDEAARSPHDFYDRADFVYRNYWFPELCRRPGVRFFALGWKNGFREGLEPREIESRRHRWSFAGQIRKTSRGRMIEAARRVPGGHVHETRSFADPEALSVREYARLLSDSVFVLSPRGFNSLDCFRVYEALEAGAIPLVEDEGGPGAWRETLAPAAFWRVQAWRRSFWLAEWRRLGRPSYWLSAYGPDFPCPRIQHWENLARVLPRIDVQATAKRCRDWWAGYKESLRSALRADVERTFLWPGS